MRKTTVGLAALLMAALGWWGAGGALAEPSCERNGNNAASCDFDGDGTSNKDDADDDNDGVPDEDDVCARDPEDLCEDSGGGGEEPDPTPTPEDLIAQIEGAINDAIGQLPPPPVEPPTEPPTEPPADPPADPTEVVAAAEALVEEVTGALPPAPSAP